MAELWGDDDYLYASYLRTRGNPSCGELFIILFFGAGFLLALWGFYYWIEVLQR